MYSHEKQYKCTIIRARAITEVDDLLPKYATVIDKLCPCTREEFEKEFNAAFREYALGRSRGTSSESSIKKTLDNHRTEVSGALFGMHYEVDGIVYASERTQKYLEDNDQPAFFKDWLLKMQFPNGMQKSQTYRAEVEDGICCHPYSLLLKVLDYADREGIVLLKQEIGYYILNSEDVLKGNATPNEVFDVIMNDKRSGREPRRIVIPEGASSSYAQHVSDQLQYLQLANLIRIDNQEIRINPNERKSILAFEELLDKPLGFDISGYNLSDRESRKEFEEDWAVYYAKLSENSESLATPIAALVPSISEDKDDKEKTDKFNKTELGDEGEAYVFRYEKDRVSKFNPRLVGKVLALGKTKGLGYDIQSVVAEKGEFAEYVKYIEVKSTKRVTAPDSKDDNWTDTVNITRNEWIAAMQHGRFYSIYRIYFVRDAIIVYVIDNPYEKSSNGEIEVVPMTYRIDFSKNAIDKHMEEVSEDA